MTRNDSRIRWLAVAIAALALAVVAAAPAGAWPDPPGGRGDGVGSGSMPSTAVQQYLAQRATATSGTSQKRTRPAARPRATNCARPTGQASKSKRACRTVSMRRR
jgi:hypothetical protein